jgi:hypothetical protein
VIVVTCPAVSETVDIPLPEIEVLVTSPDGSCVSGGLVVGAKLVTEVGIPELPSVMMLSFQDTSLTLPGLVVVKVVTDTIDGSKIGQKVKSV